MCGIAGLLRFGDEGVDAGLLERMLQPIRHRGPDDSGTFVDGRAGLAHARLEIIDPDGGHQPMCNADGSVWITFNGEIFNYVELRERLVARGHRFSTRSDTEVILHLYEEEGESCVDSLNGQWAFAIRDGRRDRLFLSRDRLGIRPLFYTEADNTFIFASEIKSILVHPGVQSALDTRALDQLFTFWMPLAPRTMFRNIRELPPGHSMTITGDRRRLTQYWSVDFSHVEEMSSEKDCPGALLDLLRDATRLRLRADVPVGSYLSGGLDSSVVTALMGQITGESPRTFSVSFEDGEFDECAHQLHVSEQLGTVHDRMTCSYRDIVRSFPAVIWHTERPVLRTAPAPLYLLSRRVRDLGYKVVLSGEGADEFLGGYDIFKEARIRRFWQRDPASSMRPLLLKRLYPYLDGFKSMNVDYLAEFFHVRPAGELDLFFSHLPRWELTSKVKRFFSKELQAECASHDVFEDLQEGLMDGFASWDTFSRAQYLEATGLLPGYILSSQGDRVAMAHAVETRFPFLDHRLVEFAARIPPTMKMKGLREKHVLKEAVGDLVPQSVLRRTKQPFRAPDGRAFFRDGASCEYMDDLLSADRIRQDGVFDPSAVEMLVRKFRRGKSLGVKDDMSLVGVLSTQIFLETFMRNFEPCTTPSLVDDSQ